VKSWRKDLTKVSERIAASLADPTEYPNLFPNLEWALKVEGSFLEIREKQVAATNYLSAKDDIDLDLIALVKDQVSQDNRSALAGVVETPHSIPNIPSTQEEIIAVHEHSVDIALNGDDTILENSHATGATPGASTVLEGPDQAPNGETSNEDAADAILNDDFGDDDDW